MALSPVTARPRQLDLHSRSDGAGDDTGASALVPLLSDYLDDVAVRTAARLGRVAGVAVTLSVEGPAAEALEPPQNPCRVGIHRRGYT